MNDQGSQRRVVIVLNDNGRSYAPTVGRLSLGLTRPRDGFAHPAGFFETLAGLTVGSHSR